MRRSMRRLLIFGGAVAAVVVWTLLNWDEIDANWDEIDDNWDGV